MGWGMQSQILQDRLTVGCDVLTVAMQVRVLLLDPIHLAQSCCGDRNGNGRACKARTCGFESRPQLQFTYQRYAWVADEVIAPD